MSGAAPNLDLDIDHYKIEDLEMFFRLQHPYDANDISKKENEIRTLLLSSGQIESYFKRDLVMFLAEGKSRLIKHKIKAQAPTTTGRSTIPKGEDLPIPHNYPVPNRKLPSREENVILPVSYQDSQLAQPINPTFRKVITKVVCVDSLFRPNLNHSDSTNFMFHLLNPINNVISMKLSTMELPNNWYIFSKRNSTSMFTIRCYNVPNTTLTRTPMIENVVEIPDGNYLSDTFQTAMMHLFANTGQGLQYIGLAVNDKTAKVEFYTGINRSITGTYPINPYENDSSTTLKDDRFYFTVDFFIPSKPLYKTFGWAMGFRKPSYTVKYMETPSTRIIESNQTYQAFLESESSFGSTYSHYVFLEVDDFQRNFSSSTIVSSTGNGDSYLSNNILSKIVVSSGQYTNIVDNGADYVFKKRNYYGPVKIEKMQIKLLNRFGDVIDLNDNNFSFTLELEVVYS
jgi:hypothetical protein